MAVKWNVLVGMCGFAVYVEVERAIWVVNDCDIEHSYSSFLFDFPSPLNIGMDRIKVGVKGVNMIIVDNDQSVIGFSEPLENDVTGRDGIVTSRIISKGFGLKILHVNVR